MSRDALVVGINTYQHLPSLRASAEDAESVARCLEGFGECRVVRLPEVITHQKPAISAKGAVTTSILESALIKLFKPSGKTIPQTAIFYYSGHGLQRQAGIQEGYLATTDANPAAGHYGLSLHWLRRLLQESPVRQRVILLDCCNSGEFFNMLEADPGAHAGTDRLFMAAAREYESAYESLDSKHSVFTQALLSGLNPYKVKGGVVNGHSLTDAVNRELKGELQQPLFESSGGEIVLTRMAGLTTSAQTATTPSLLERLQKLRHGFCPFPGEAAFSAAQGEFFFGREEVTQTLVSRVRRSRLCALVGGSGTGKTSLLQAGLMPSVNQADDPSPWQVHYLSFGETPLTNLAEVFVEAKASGLQRAEQLRQAESFLQQGPEGFCQLVQARASAAPWVLILDQFETVLRPGLVAERDRTLIIDCLLTAIQQPHLPLHIVLGLGTYHSDDLARFPQLQALVLEHSLAMPAMTYNQLKATIVGPLDKLGYRYDANLVYTLLLDVVSAPADLALLQLTLKELWSRREVNATSHEAPSLTLAAYAEMGGIRHLLNRRANDLYESLSSSEQTIAKRIFLGLCDLGEGATLTRRPLMLSELITATIAADAVVNLLNRLIAKRLIVAQGPMIDHFENQGLVAVPGWASTPVEEETPLITSSLLATHPSMAPGYPYFDLAHEALLRNWPLLQQWVQAQGPKIRQQRAIEVAAQEWHQEQQPNHADYFLTKTRLNEAKAFRQEHPDQLSVLAQHYLEACDRHSRRSCRQRHLVRLLIPLSMATGMVTAYSHSHLSPTAHDTSLPTNSAAGVDDVTAAFELLPAAAEEQPPDLTMGSPQIAVVRTDLIPLPAGARPTHPAQPHQATAPQLETILTRSIEGYQALAAQTATLPPVPANPVLTTPMPKLSSQGMALPPANQMVKLESWWISPDDPSMVVQIWCTQSGPEPVCFTSSAAKNP
ncbi:caspase family protein [Nodosilinea sp. LEGE 07088]|uniref:nSTAND1 domain-containing NTPase n=1 Tax=Nodosilinea sp. LEGE 07088 TaxID=2777968 RepID=UPI001880CA1B|nr:caspase family protein [Nodosilinea sp. LEGE 07088]MBE9139453.1 caspase family protein [Nodosilinea sp. LEGE 07088]